MVSMVLTVCPVSCTGQRPVGGERATCYVHRTTAHLSWQIFLHVALVGLWVRSVEVADSGVGRSSVVASVAPCSPVAGSRYMFTRISAQLCCSLILPVHLPLSSASVMSSQCSSTGGAMTVVHVTFECHGNNGHEPRCGRLLVRKD